MSVPFEGIFPAIVTPFTADGASVNEDALAAVVRHQLDAGVGGVIPCGSTSEFISMSNAERKRVVEVVASTIGGAVPMIASTGALTTAEAIELSLHAEENGAAAVMVMPPYYEPVTWPELLGHFQAISEALTIPIMYYHMPAASGFELSMDQFKELTDIENVSLAKDSSANAVQQAELVFELGDRLTVFNGEDKMTFASLAGGARAGVWGASTFFPGLAVELFEALAVKSDLEAGREVWKRIWPIMSLMGEISYQSAVKAGCQAVGLEVGPTRLPLAPAPADFVKRMAATLEASGVATAL